MSEWDNQFDTLIKIGWFLFVSAIIAAIAAGVAIGKWLL